jgi:hypothetical protein
MWDYIIVYRLFPDISHPAKKARKSKMRGPHPLCGESVLCTARVLAYPPFGQSSGQAGRPAAHKIMGQRFNFESWDNNYPADAKFELVQSFSEYRQSDPVFGAVKNNCAGIDKITKEGRFLSRLSCILSGRKSPKPIKP